MAVIGSPSQLMECGDGRAYSGLDILREIPSVSSLRGYHNAGVWEVWSEARMSFQTIRAPLRDRRL